MRALFLNCTLKPSPQESNTERLASVVAEALEAEGVKRVLERMDAMLSEADDGVPVAYNRVAGFVVPGQAWTYWNMGPGPGPSYSDTDHGHEWSHTTGSRAAAQNLLATPHALAASPIPAPPS